MRSEELRHKSESDPFVSRAEYNALIDAVQQVIAAQNAYEGSGLAGVTPREIIAPADFKVRCALAIPQYAVFVQKFYNDVASNPHIPTGELTVVEVIRSLDDVDQLLYTNPDSAITATNTGYARIIGDFVPSRVLIDPNPATTLPIVGQQCGPVSGTFGVCLEGRGLVCVGMEVDEEYCWVIAPRQVANVVGKTTTSVSPRAGSIPGNGLMEVYISYDGVSGTLTPSGVILSVNNIATQPVNPNTWVKAKHIDRALYLENDSTGTDDILVKIISPTQDPTTCLFDGVTLKTGSLPSWCNDPFPNDQLCFIRILKSAPSDHGNVNEIYQGVYVGELAIAGDDTGATRPVYAVENKKAGGTNIYSAQLYGVLACSNTIASIHNVQSYSGAAAPTGPNIDWAHNYLGWCGALNDFCLIIEDLGLDPPEYTLLSVKWDNAINTRRVSINGANELELLDQRTVYKGEVPTIDTHSLFGFSDVFVVSSVDWAAPSLTLTSIRIRTIAAPPLPSSHAIVTFAEVFPIIDIEYDGLYNLTYTWEAMFVIPSATGTGTVPWLALEHANMVSEVELAGGAVREKKRDLTVIKAPAEGAPSNIFTVVTSTVVEELAFAGNDLQKKSRTLSSIGPLAALGGAVTILTKVDTTVVTSVYMTGLDLFANYTAMTVFSPVGGTSPLLVIEGTECPEGLTLRIEDEKTIDEVKKLEEKKDEE